MKESSKSITNDNFVVSLIEGIIAIIEREGVSIVEEVAQSAQAPLKGTFQTLLWVQPRDASLPKQGILLRGS